MFCDALKVIDVENLSKALSKIRMKNIIYWLAAGITFTLRFWER